MSSIPTPIVPAYLDTQDAAKYLSITAENPEQMRHRGSGPPYAKVGRSILYARADLDKWMRALVQRAIEAVS